MHTYTHSMDWSECTHFTLKSTEECDCTQSLTLQRTVCTGAITLLKGVTTYSMALQRGRDYTWELGKLSPAYSSPLCSLQPTPAHPTPSQPISSLFWSSTHSNLFQSIPPIPQSQSISANFQPISDHSAHSTPSHCREIRWVQRGGQIH